LGQVVSKSAVEQNVYLDEVAKGAKDLSSLVRKKGASDSQSRKRSGGTPEQEETAKRARTEDLE
jgi:hypothetical protein